MIVTRHSAVAGDNGKFNGTQDASNRYDRRQANHSIIQLLARLSNIEICQMEFSVVNRQETYATPICQLVYSVVCTAATIRQHYFLRFFCQTQYYFISR